MNKLFITAGIVVLLFLGLKTIPLSKVDEVQKNTATGEETTVSTLEPQKSYRFERVPSGCTVTDIQGNVYYSDKGDLYTLSTYHEAIPNGDILEQGTISYWIPENGMRLHGVVAVDSISNKDILTDFSIIANGIVVFHLPLTQDTEPTEIDIGLTDIKSVFIRVAHFSENGTVGVILSDFNIQ